MSEIATSVLIAGGPGTAVVSRFRSAGWRVVVRPLRAVDSLAANYLADGVRVNAVLPSVIDTPPNRAGQPETDHSRWVHPDRIADVLLFLSGDLASVINGAHIPLYGRA